MDCCGFFALLVEEDSCFMCLLGWTSSCGGICSMYGVALVSTTNSGIGKVFTLCEGKIFFANEFFFSDSFTQMSVGLARIK